MYNEVLRDFGLHLKNFFNGLLKFCGFRGGDYIKKERFDELTLSSTRRLKIGLEQLNMEMLTSYLDSRRARGDLKLSKHTLSTFFNQVRNSDTYGSNFDLKYGSSGISK